MESSPTHRARQAGCSSGSAQAGGTPSRDALPHHARELAGVRPLPQDVVLGTRLVAQRTRCSTGAPHRADAGRGGDAGGQHAAGPRVSTHGRRTYCRTEADAEIYLSERRGASPERELVSKAYIRVFYAKKKVASDRESTCYVVLVSSCRSSLSSSRARAALPALVIAHGAAPRRGSPVRMSGRARFRIGLQTIRPSGKID